MSRCRACNTILSENNSRPVYNKYTLLEDDLCATCVAISRDTFMPHEYLFGRNPQEGVTPPVPLGND